MKYIYLFLLLFNINSFATEGFYLTGKIEAPQKCIKDKIVVWVSVEEKNKVSFIYEVQTAHNKTVFFHLLPKPYILSFLSESGCQLDQKIDLKNSQSMTFKLKEMN